MNERMNEAIGKKPTMYTGLHNYKELIQMHV